MKLPAEIESALEPLMSEHGGIGSVELLAMPRLVADYVEKAIVFTTAARPALLVMIAPPAYPDAVRDAFARAAAARSALGDSRAAASVQVALHQGMTDRQSFAVVPYLTPMGRGRLRRRWDRWRLRGPVFEWLEEVTRRTVAAVPETAYETGFLAPLAALSRMPQLDQRVREGAGASRRALEAGRWRPRWVLAHNDLWLGNLLFRPRPPPGTPGFAVIDWGASRSRGQPAYDFFSFANSVNLKPSPLRRRLAAYCEALGCAPSEVRHHLLAALAAHATSLGEWPVERFAATAQRLFDLADSAS